MAVLLLDPRFPDVMPIAVATMEGKTATYTAEVPVSVRWALCDTFPTASDEEADLLITTDLQGEQASQWLAGGHELFKVPTATIRHPEVTTAADVMAAARHRGEWEASQTHESLLPYLTEEVDEFIEAVRSGASDEEIKKELSDIFLQVLFHAQIASERGAFDLGDVAQAFTDKMHSRAPSLFDGSTGHVTTSAQEEMWQEGKRRERAAADPAQPPAEQATPAVEQPADSAKAPEGAAEESTASSGDE